ncbi:MAG: hypothetical protein QF682_03310 [Candidatus Thermoplasmatota archaeon]|jgi:hypothetical protein|nr:hypothetical protein [Candidatus Thermoplasmatota archaeon]
MKKLDIAMVVFSAKRENPDEMIFAADGKPTSYRDLLDRIANTSEKKKQPDQKTSTSKETGDALNETEYRKCGICLEGFRPNSKVVKCNCGRAYHIICATQVGECPICDVDLLDLSSRLMGRGKVKDYSFIWGK